MPGGISIRDQRGHTPLAGAVVAGAFAGFHPWNLNHAHGCRRAADLHIEPGH